jgi:hypothetical protein
VVDVSSDALGILTPNLHAVSMVAARINIGIRV